MNTKSDSSFEADLPNLVELLRWRALHQPDQLAYTFLADGATEEISITYTQLDGWARAIGTQLQSLKATGERALLLYPPGLEYIAAFFGCLYAGVVAIPAYPPRLNKPVSRLRTIVEDAHPKLALTNSKVLAKNVKRRFAQVQELEGLHWLAIDNVAVGVEADWQEPAITSDTLAFLQYTSGSTAMPKGVMVSHGNLLSNLQSIQTGFQHTKQSIGVGWLPLYHDLGLIGNVLQPLYVGFPCILMSPADFAWKPFRWLQAVSRYKATTSGAPNFAYDLCIEKITPKQRETLDLSSWSVAFNGGEPIRHETIERFAATFESCGFQRKAFYPCYGLAEATLIVSGGLKEAPPVFYTVQEAALEHSQVVGVTSGDGGSQTLVGCGKSLLNQKLVVAHPETLTKSSPGEVGEILVSGPSVTQGYWNQPVETAHMFRAYLSDTGEGPFLRTGDLGFLHDGELFITGRIKDLIIIRGRNHYPQDLELTVERSHPALEAFSGAAFSVEVEGEERLVIVQALKRHHQNPDVDEVIGTIRRKVAENHELQVYSIVLVKPFSIPKTSSGKIRRHACRKRFLEDGLNVVGAWKSEIAEPAEPRKVSKPVDSTISLHNAIYGPTAAMSQMTEAVEIDDVVQSKAKNNASRALTGELLQWLRNYTNERINSRLIDERRTIPPYIVLDLGNRGLLGMQVPSKYAGLGLNHYDTMRVLEQLGAIDQTLSLFIGLNNILGIRPILKYASDTVRDELLPILATGRELCAFALTEPGAGSNPRAISARAIPDTEGNWRLRGTKIWSGSAAWAGVINVFVQQLDANGKSQGISSFVVRQGTHGLRQGPEALTMGMRGLIQNTVYLDDVSVGPQHLLGEPGAGMNVAQDAMMYGRLAIAAACVGGMKRCTQLMLRYGERRSISTGRLLDNPVTLSKLSDLTAAIATVESLVARISELLDDGSFVPVEAFTACKIAAPEFFWKAADTLVQMLGGRGYIETNIAPQILRDARVLRIFEGPTETLTMFLGSRAVNDHEKLHQFLRHDLSSVMISDRLREAVEQVKKLCTGPKRPFSDHTSTTQWAYALIGEMTTFAILLAAVQRGNGRAVPAHLRRVIEWAQIQFEHKIDIALSGNPAESLLSGPDAIRELISDYAEAIGDLGQTLVGPDYELDALLRQNHSKIAADLKSNAALEIRTKREAPQHKEYKYTDSLQDISIHTAESIRQWIVNWLVRELNLRPELVDTNRPFAHYGMDSVKAVELALSLEEWLGNGLELEATIAWNFPTIESLAEYLASELDILSSTPEVQLMHQIQSQKDGDEPIEARIDLETLSESEIAHLLAKEIAAVKNREAK